MNNEGANHDHYEFKENPGEARIWNALFDAKIDLPDECVRLLRRAVMSVVHIGTGRLDHDPSADKAAGDYLREAIEASKED